MGDLRAPRRLIFYGAGHREGIAFAWDLARPPGTPASRSRGFLHGRMCCLAVVLSVGFTYTKISRKQNLHGRNLQGQNAIPPSIFGPRVALFSEPEPWAYKHCCNGRIFPFLNVLKFYSCQLCLCLPASHFFQNESRGSASNRRVLQFSNF